MDYEQIAEEVTVVSLSMSKVYTMSHDTEEFLSFEEIEISAEESVEAQRANNREYLPASHEKYQGIASDRGYSQDSARLQRVHYTHDAMIDVIIAEPEILQKDLAARFNKSQWWISRIMGSDAFQAALAKRREEITDPFLIATIEERFNGLAMQSIDVLAEKLEATQNADLALKALDISSKALGFGARNSKGAPVQNNFVVQLPPKAENSEEWAARHAKVLEAK